MITTNVDYQNSSRGINISVLLSLALSRSINRFHIILSLKSLLSVAKTEKSSKDGGVVRKQSVLG